MKTQVMNILSDVKPGDYLFVFNHRGPNRIVAVKSVTKKYANCGFSKYDIETGKEFRGSNKARRAASDEVSAHHAMLRRQAQEHQAAEAERNSPRNKAISHIIYTLENESSKYTDDQIFAAKTALESSGASQ